MTDKEREKREKQKENRKRNIKRVTTSKILDLMTEPRYAGKIHIPLIKGKRTHVELSQFPVT